VNEHDKLEKRVEVHVTHLTTNADKIRKQRLRGGTLDLRRLDATVRIEKELRMVSDMLNELWEIPECVEIVRS
jgi:hypothetical protein